MLNDILENALNLFAIFVIMTLMVGVPLWLLRKYYLEVFMDNDVEYLLTVIDWLILMVITAVFLQYVL